MIKHDFGGKVAFVTGAASGLGFAAAQAFARAGAKVAMADVNGQSLARSAGLLRDAGATVLPLIFDVAIEEEVAQAVETTVKAFGALDAAFNNAGLQFEAAETADAIGAHFDRVIAVNLRGVWSCMKYELQQMRTQGSGAIVNCSSVCGLIGIPGRGDYHASKHGVIGMTRTAALEYAARGIRINAVCPGTIETPLVRRIIENEPGALESILRNQPIGRLGQADEVAEAVLWLCGPGASLVVGHALSVDGGWTAQ
jgi:NAD(P)-dependent dehydrogenase (short-subunit alcohol dehydrogenase family)